MRPGTTTKYETRIIKKDEAGKWTMTTYAWDRDQTIASLLTTGQENVFGDSHDIPTQAQCSRCHTSAERVLGFSAIQLSPTGMLGELVRRGQLINWANADEASSIAQAEVNGAEAVELAQQEALTNYVARAAIQGDATQKDAVGYLHANCGHCHGGPFPAAQMSLFSQVLTTLPTVAIEHPAPNGVTAVCDPSGWTVRPTTNALPDGVKLTPYAYRIHPGAPEDSAVLARMMIRDPGKPTDFKPNQMPPLATEQPHNDGIVKVTNWIKGLTTTCEPVQREVEAPEAIF